MYLLSFLRVHEMLCLGLCKQPLVPFQQMLHCNVVFQRWVVLRRRMHILKISDGCFLETQIISDIDNDRQCIWLYNYYQILIDHEHKWMWSGCEFTDNIKSSDFFFPVQVLILDPPRRGLACQSWRSGLPAGQEEVDRIRQSFLAIFRLRWSELQMTKKQPCWL